MKWSTYCLVTHHRTNLDLEMATYFEIADSDRSYDEEANAYLETADPALETDASTTGAASTSDTWTRPSPSGSPAPTSTDCWSRPCSNVPAHEQEQFLAHFRGLIGMWVREQGDLVASGVGFLYNQRCGCGRVATLLNCDVQGRSA